MSQLADVLPISIRAVAACALCLSFGLLFGHHCIAWLKARFREPIKSISPTVERLHQHKSATPTMGGLFIALAIVFGTALVADMHDPRVGIAMCAVVGFASLGAIDDLVKLRTTRRGISARTKFIGQIVLAVVIAAMMRQSDPSLSLPQLVFAAFILVASTNAVNLTDGLDGLAGGRALTATLAMLPVLWVSEAIELAVIAAATVGTLIAFLRFNLHPARVFMGDTGSQALGAQLAIFAIFAKSPWLFAIVSGVFVMEAASVVIQMASYRLRGKRFFLCAPLHHHFQFLGWPEPLIVRSFWSMGVACAVLGLLLMKHPASFPTSKTWSDGENFSPPARVQPNEPSVRVASLGRKLQP